MHQLKYDFTWTTFVSLGWQTFKHIGHYYGSTWVKISGQFKVKEKLITKQRIFGGSSSFLISTYLVGWK